MTISSGRKVWIPCEVKPGPFTDERLVRVSQPGGDWVGFVPANHLQDPTIETGTTFVLAVITQVDGSGVFEAAILGHSITSHLFHGTTKDLVNTNA